MAVKVSKKFYVGNAAFLKPDSPYTKTTLEEAIDAARSKVETTGTDQIVVQIIRVVKKQAQPTVVEEVW